MSDLNKLADAYLSIKNQISQLESSLDEVKGEMYTMLIDKIQSKGEGTISEKTDKYKVSITTKKNVTVDQALAMQYARLFKVKYDYSKVIHEECSDEEKKMIEECISVKDAKPSFKVEGVE